MNLTLMTSLPGVAAKRAAEKLFVAGECRGEIRKVEAEIAEIQKQQNAIEAEAQPAIDRAAAKADQAHEAFLNACQAVQDLRSQLGSNVMPLAERRRVARNRLRDLQGELERFEAQGE
jgi:hypothetical protein